MTTNATPPDVQARAQRSALAETADLPPRLAGPRQVVAAARQWWQTAYVVRGRSGGTPSNRCVTESVAEAIRKGHMQLWYQPVFQIHSRSPTGIEALARWAHPELGLLTPGQFLHNARGCDLRALDEWALAQACTDFAALRESLGDRAPNHCAVNLSTHTLTTQFDRLVERALAETGLAGCHLVLELSEQIAFDALTAAAPRLERLRRLGVHLVLDDICSGLTTLRHLAIDTVDGLKIDAAFVDGMLRDHRQHTVVRVLADLGRHLSIPVIAEGVETVDQLTALAALGIEFAQGFYLGRPQPLSALTAQMRRR